MGEPNILLDALLAEAGISHAGLAARINAAMEPLDVPGGPPPAGGRYGHMIRRIRHAGWVCPSTMSCCVISVATRFRLVGLWSVMR